MRTAAAALVAALVCAGLVSLLAGALTAPASVGTGSNFTWTGDGATAWRVIGWTFLVTGPAFFVGFLVSFFRSPVRRNAHLTY